MAQPKLPEARGLQQTGVQLQRRLGADGSRSRHATVPKQAALSISSSG
jgi:hypothetical protein